MAPLRAIALVHVRSAMYGCCRPPSPMKPPCGTHTPTTNACTRYNAKAHVNRGVLLMEGGRLEEARQAFSDAAAIEPLLPQALYNLG